MKTPPRTLAAPALALLLAATLTACSNAPRTPDWQIEAKGALDRTIAAYLTGNARVEQAEMAHTRQQLASTGRADLAAAAELRYCAARVASLVWEACAGFDALRQDATPAQRAYADYLRGQMSAATIALLLPPQRAAATRTDTDGSALQNMEDPLSLLVAAGVLLQTGKANPAVIEQAVAAASAQGWRRPLLAWLGVQLQRARQAGQTEEAERISRRIELVQGR
ncbi:MAG: hypothetical protein HYX43_08270 [Burkholderiales bacterium]|nr:hypothetical protein [Burkholderiales bacterium]